MTIEYTGFHGSDFDNVKSILAENFRESENNDEWLGYGVYFFVEGISEPKENAIEWARNQSYANGKLKYDKYAVFKAKVVCDRVLDTTNTQGLAAFNTLRNALIKKHDDCFQKNRDFRSDDRVMWNLVAQTMKLDAVVHNLYIKDRVQRIKKIGSNVPNTTVLCVKVPTSIVRETIEVVCDGEVRQ
ncbi:hypothetical protein V8050_002925 [Vibrio parahaemolyticus]|nr:hypothetical protein [Vibrio parahaemolyticus]EJG0710209.1 hypothetical protein [Vibrio parahaemolyticus]HAS6746129.1 hypothetical protein [Vibrio parahaemolyticus]HAS6765937.1 hypothetical protein [Vibrio parahaemolyticus]